MEILVKKILKLKVLVQSKRLLKREEALFVMNKASSDVVNNKKKGKGRLL